MPGRTRTYHYHIFFQEHEGQVLRALYRDFTPYAGEPWLLISRETCRAVVMGDFDEPGISEVAPPAFQIVVHAIASLVPALLVISPGVRAE